MRNVRLTIEYDGTDYSGWQFQTNGVSIQEIVEKALRKMTGEKVSVKGASRTDAGVHALAQTANFLTESRVPITAFKDGLNSLLPEDIIVKDVCEMNARFDAIKSAIKKRYRYCIQTGKDTSIITRRFSWKIWRPLDLEAMRKASRLLIGRRDFRAFQATGSDTKTSTRNLMSVDLDEGPMELLFLDFVADGFLKYMVRNIVGTLVYVGERRIKEGEVKDILESKDRKKAGPTAPSCGLFLVKVYYN